MCCLSGRCNSVLPQTESEGKQSLECAYSHMTKFAMSYLACMFMIIWCWKIERRLQWFCFSTSKETETISVIRTVSSFKHHCLLIDVPVGLRVTCLKTQVPMQIHLLLESLYKSSNFDLSMYFTHILLIESYSNQWNLMEWHIWKPWNMSIWCSFLWNSWTTV